ncbi:MAG: MarR family winged helix-turn-helix transcriptional regulator [Janthinobacterium lividum]
MKTNLRQVFDDLVRFETMLWGAVDDRLREECGMTLAALNVLMIIGETASCRVLDIAQALAITVGGVSQAVDRLEAAGHVERRANPADRRSSILDLTPQGVALIELAAPLFDQELELLLRAPLSPSALTALGDALATLRQGFTAQVPATSAAPH